MCNNKETFEAEMKLFGVYIPEQDASWEREGTIYILRKHFEGGRGRQKIASFAYFQIVQKLCLCRKEGVRKA